MTTLALTGELTIMTAADRKTELLEALAGGEDSLDLDVSAVTELDTAGLQVLLLVKREGAELGRAVRLVAPGPAVTEALDISWLDASLEARPLRGKAG